MFGIFKKKPVSPQYPEAYGRRGKTAPLDESFRKPADSADRDFNDTLQSTVGTDNESAGTPPDERVTSLDNPSKIAPTRVPVASKLAETEAEDSKLQTPVKALPLPSMAETMECLPAEVVIKRIWPRKGTGNKWQVRFHNHGTEYYGVTLEAALTSLFKNQKLVAARFAANRALAEADE